MSRPDGDVIEVGRVEVRDGATGRRVSALVEGEPLWFESPDLALAPAPEAFGSALLMPALHRRARLRLADPVDPAWLANTASLVAILRQWWRYPAWPPEAVARTADPPGAEPPRGTALFFSGGVDSFHVLLRGGERVDWLVSLQGFDFPLADTVRAAPAEASVRAVAAATGARAAIVRTNAREHPLVRPITWDRAHGGVLGGVAHLLAPVASRVLVAASAPGDQEIPWGQHWRLDPLWSSSRTAVVHSGRGARRLDKLRAIAAEPLVHEHLRVCWQNRSPTGNCSRCNKCVLAMLILEECGELRHARVFDGRDELARRIAQLRGTRDRIHTFAEVLESPRLDESILREGRAFLRRSRHLVRPDVVFRRRLRERLRRWLGGKPR